MLQIWPYLAQKLIDFVFKQKSEVVILLLVAFALGGAVIMLWLKVGDVESDGKIERVEIRKECAASIAELRNDLRACQNENDTLRKENAVLSGRFAAMEARLKKNYVK